MGIYEKDFHVRYFDLGEKNTLSITGLMSLLQEIAGMHSSYVGYGLNDIEKTNLTWYLLYWKIKILKKPIWNTKLHIKTWARKLEKVSSFRDFEVYDENKDKIAIASSKWALWNVRTNSISRIPESMNDEYGVIESSVFDDKTDGKIKIPEDGICSYEYTIRRRDIDTNHHVNNLYYLDFALQSLPEKIYYNTDFTEIEVLYKKQIKINEKIKCFYTNEDNGTNTVVIKSEDEKTVHAVVKLK